MQIDDFFWNYFEKTGVIDAYLMYKNYNEEIDDKILVVSEDILAVSEDLLVFCEDTLAVSEEKL